MRTIAGLAVVCAAAWLSLNVWGNYGGHISGLFYTGAKVALPPELDGSHTRRVRGDDIGYDAQYYRLAAHDPLLRRGFAAFADDPSLRWRRIGVPALAALLSVGHEGAVDALFVAIQLGFVFAGAFWLTRYAKRVGRDPVWGLAFLLIPATAISLDRMTIDLPLAALTIGLALYSIDERPNWGRYLILTAAPLVRETGMVLTLAWSLWAVARREWREALRSAACTILAALWWIYVRQNTPRDETPWLATYPFSGIVNRVHEAWGPVTTLWLRAALVLEWVALAGVVLALLLAFVVAARRQPGILETGAIVFAIFRGIAGQDRYLGLGLRVRAHHVSAAGAARTDRAARPEALSAAADPADSAPHRVAIRSSNCRCDPRVSYARDICLALASTYGPSGRTAIFAPGRNPSSNSASALSADVNAVPQSSGQ